MLNLYAVLNCPPNATREQLQTEYRLLARKLHPDKHNHNHNHTTSLPSSSHTSHSSAIPENRPQNASSTPSPLQQAVTVSQRVTFADVQDAWSILGSPESRKEYDSWYFSGLDIPFSEWKRLHIAKHHAAHWCNRAVPSLEPPPPSSSPAETHPHTASEHLYRQFRSYQI